MDARKVDVNYTSVNVVYCPKSTFERAVVQVTVRPGKTQDDAEHIAMQNFLASVKKLQETCL
jgi:hypothetical protein